MRVLLGCSLGGVGHLTPVVAAARAVGAIGHDSIVLVPPSLAAAAAQAGVEVSVGAQPPQEVVDDVWRRVRAGPPEAVVGLIDRELFAERCTDAMLEAACRLCREWRPQVVIRESCEYATAVVAHQAGIADSQLGISQAAIDHQVLEMVAPALDRRARGLAAAVAAAPYVTSFPASLDPSPWARTIRFRVPRARPRRLPDWWPGDHRPLIYMTFGTVLGHLAEAAAVYRTALDAVSGLPARVLLTVGRAVKPAGLGPIPDNTHVERWVAQHEVFGQADLVVCHGGSGTTFGALAAGLPLVICPLFADQTANAQLVERAGAGITFRPTDRMAGAIASLGPADTAPLRQAIRSALAEPRHRRAALGIGRELARAPALEDVLERLLTGSATP